MASQCCPDFLDGFGVKLETTDQGVSLHLQASDKKKAKALSKLIQSLQTLCPCDGWTDTDQKDQQAAP